MCHAELLHQHLLYSNIISSKLIQRRERFHSQCPPGHLPIVPCQHFCLNTLNISSVHQPPTGLCSVAISEHFKWVTWSRQTVACIHQQDHNRDGISDQARDNCGVQLLVSVSGPAPCSQHQCTMVPVMKCYQL